MTTCARKATTSAEVVVFCFSGGYDRIRKLGKQKETVGVESEAYTGACFETATLLIGTQIVKL